MSDGLRGAVAEQAAIGQRGERVVVREVLEARLVRLALADVARDGRAETDAASAARWAIITCDTGTAVPSAASTALSPCQMPSRSLAASASWSRSSTVAGGWNEAMLRPLTDGSFTP